MSDWETIDERDLPDRPRQEVGEVVAGDSAAHLSTLVPKALHVLETQLDLESFPGDKDFLLVQKAKRLAAMGVLQTAVRVDEATLRKREASFLPRFLEELKEARLRREALEGKVIEP